MEWTKQQEKIMTKYYPKLGTKVKEFLPDKTPNAIEHKARNMGIKYTGGLHPDGPSGYLDIETSGLQADFGFMYCWSIKVADNDKIYWDIITPEEIHNGTLDKRIMKSLIETLKIFKRVYTFYGTEFDVKFARTRALYHGLDFIPYGLVEHKDVYYMSKRLLCIHSHRLEATADLMEIKGKTHLEPRYWVMANTGNLEALGYILDHNKKDVILLEKVHKKLQEYQADSRRFI
jgi:uncharacterized protein YprB with RNaseH-like and TPR domain